jgi:hypothetical protein
MLTAFIGQAVAEGGAEYPAENAGASYAAGQKAEAYAYTHGGYVARAIATVLWDGSVSVDIDEAFLPHTLAIVDYEETEWTETNTVYYLSRGSEVRVAKYIEYAGKVYVGTTVGGSLTYVEADDKGMAAGGTDLELLILRNQATMAAYYKNIKSGGFKIFTEFGGTATPVTATHYGGVTKNDSPGYWNTGQTWIGNVNAIESFIYEYGSDYSNADMVRAAEADANGLKFWSVADAVSGATNSDFPDYFNVAQAAISRLRKM